MFISVTIALGSEKNDFIYLALFSEGTPDQVWLQIHASPVRV